MKIIIVSLICLIFGSCFFISDPADNFEECAYEFKYSLKHHLEVPYRIIPNKNSYKVGDTIIVRALFSDSIYDLSRQVHFKIQGFPFEPVNLLYKINEEGWESGYRVNELIVDDEQYNTRYNFQSAYSDDMRGFTVYENGMYHFEYLIVLKTSGKYCTLISDQYQQNTAGSGQNNDIADAIQFEGRCQDFDYKVCSVINGPTNIDDFLDQLIYIDKEVYNDNLVQLEAENAELFGKSGFLVIEWNGVFCFEVVE